MRLVTFAFAVIFAASAPLLADAKSHGKGTIGHYSHLSDNHHDCETSPPPSSSSTHAPAHAPVHGSDPAHFCIDVLGICF
jgi:hypothetical protein